MTSHTHNYHNMGRESINSIMFTVWKCDGCSDKKYTPAGTVVRTFP